MLPLLTVAAVLAASAAFGVWWRRRDGRTRATDTRLDAADLAALGIEDFGERATLVQFSSAFCQPCRATRRVLSDVAGLVDGVTYAEVDAETHLDATRRLHVLRTPTVLVLDRDRRVVVRASGQPRKVDVLAALGRAIGSTSGP